MKCYLCGQQTTKHAVNCPNFVTSQTAEKVIKEADEAIQKLPITDDIDKEINEIFGYNEYRPHKNRKGLWIKEPKLKKAFLSLTPKEPIASAMWNKTETGRIQVQSDVPCRPYRLWVDESIASCFDLINAFIGATDQANASYDLKGIPASMFRTGRWPLPPNPDKDSEWGIDLSTWKTIEISHMFTLVVRNNAPNAMPFRGALEVWTVES